MKPASSAAYFLLAAICATILVGCSTTGPLPDKPALASGRGRVLQALAPQKKGSGLLKSGLISTALSSSDFRAAEPLKHLDADGEHGGRPFSLTLTDGTRVGGLLFPFPTAGDEPKPLLMASFGFLQDRWGTEAAKFYEFYLEDNAHRLPAHVLFLDHPSAGPFLAENDCLSMGSYDDARMWIEVAQHLQERMQLSSIHLFGVSMSGQTVVHALMEDKRLGLDLFDSGIAVSIAPDFKQAPGKQLAYLKTSDGMENPWRRDLEPLPPMGLADKIQGAALGLLIEKQFVQHYRLICPSDTTFDLKADQAAVFLRKAFEARITRLRQQKADTWNWEIDLTDLDTFMASTRIAGFVGRVRTPLVLVSALDDPAVEHPLFAEVAKAAAGNSWVAVYETDHGGHFGFDMVYGSDYLERVIRLMMTPEVIDHWP